MNAIDCSRTLTRTSLKTWMRRSAPWTAAAAASPSARNKETPCTGSSERERERENEREIVMSHIKHLILFYYSVFNDVLLKKTQKGVTENVVLRIFLRE